MSREISKIQFASFGGPSVVKVINATLEAPPRDHIQVKVLYSGFSGADINMRNGTYPRQRAAPLTPGYCLIGEVTSTGERANKFTPGTIIAAITMYDAEATYSNIPQKYCVNAPDGLDWKVACALILDWTTAYGLVYRCAKVKAGDRVFIHGLSGAVGLAVLRLCKSIGAEIYGTASARNHGELKNLGVTAVFDYRNKEWIEAMNKIDGVNVVFDALGFESWDESWTILSKNVHSVLVGFGGNLQTLNEDENSRNQIWGIVKLLLKNGCYGKRSTRFFYVERDSKEYWTDLQTVFELARTGEIEVSIKTEFKGLEEIPQAHKEWTKLQGMGSCIVDLR